MEQTIDKIYSSTDYRSLTDPERTIFKAVVTTLRERGLFSEADVPVIAGYARNVVLARTAARDVQKAGVVIKFQDRGCDKWKENPAVAVMHKAQNAYEATALKLGLTPTGRRRMKTMEAAPKSALEQFEEEGDD